MMWTDRFSYAFSEKEVYKTCVLGGEEVGIVIGVIYKVIKKTCVLLTWAYFFLYCFFLISAFPFNTHSEILGQERHATTFSSSGLDMSPVCVKPKFSFGDHCFFFLKWFVIGLPCSKLKPPELIIICRPLLNAKIWEWAQKCGMSSFYHPLES